MARGLFIPFLPLFFLGRLLEGLFNLPHFLLDTKRNAQSDQDDNWNWVVFGLEEIGLDIQLNKINVTQLNYSFRQYKKEIKKQQQNQYVIRRGR